MSPRTEHVVDHVDDFLQDLLDAETTAYTIRHCSECADCAAALDEARRRVTALQTLPPSEASESLVQATVAGVAEYDRRQRRLHRRVFGSMFALVTTAAAIIAAFHIHYAYLTPDPIDLKVLGQTQLLADADGSLRVLLIDHTNAQTRAGVPVRISLRNKSSGETVELASFTTDAQGTGQPRFHVPDWSGADCELQVSADDAGHESITYPVTVRRSRQVMLSSDKPVYQPGQIIHIRSLALRRPDLQPVAGEEATFTVTDPNGNVIFKNRTKNSEYGIASTDCELATEILEGDYVIGCTIGDTASRFGVEVKKYVLPKFKIVLTLDKPYYAPKDKLTATIDAAYFFGKPVAGATVELRVNIPGEESLSQTAKTGDNGKAVIAFGLPGDRDGNVTLTAAITDTAGQKQEKTATAVVSQSPLKIEVFAENGTVLAGYANTIYVFTTYADGRPAQTRISAPAPVPLRGRTNPLGMMEFLYMADDDGLNVTLTAEDDHGVCATQNVRIPRGPSGRDFLLRTDKAVYDGGDTLTLTILGGGTEPVFLDILKDGQTRLTETVYLSNGKGDLHIDLPPDLSGTLQLCAYRFAPNGTTIRKTRTLYVRLAGNLQVQTTTNQTEYRPDQSAKVDLALRDKMGRPIRGAVSLAAVDEAVFSVLDKAPGSEESVFGAQPELLRPVQSLYPWSPDQKAVLPPVERERFEQGLFAQTVRTVSLSEAASDQSERPDAPNTWPRLSAQSTFGQDTAAVEEQRRSGIHHVKLAWLLLAIATLLVMYISIAAFSPALDSSLAVGIGIVLVVLVFPICCFLYFGLSESQYSFSGQFNAESSTAGAPAIENQSDLTKDEVASDPDIPLAHKNDRLTDTVAKSTLRLDEVSVPRVRRYFPETLYWQPQLITDDAGRASIDLKLADSITTWRLSASAVSRDGRLGAAQTGIKVFQPFFVDVNLPVEMTRGDEVAVPVVVYSYLDKPQTVALTLDHGDWFECLDNTAQKIDLPPRAVRSVSYRLRVKTVGRHALQVTARGGELADAIRRDIEVVPNGRRVEQVANGNLAAPADATLTIPEDAIPGSAKAFVKLYPSTFSQLVEGLDGIFQQPYGCFEQTSSTTYPNVLALEYLRQTNRAAPEIKEKAERYIHLGYQRLLSFEVPDGGFDWFGRPPANRTLTAYGLMEFQDMAKVYEVDPKLIERTRNWLLKQREADGSWAPESHSLHGDPGQGRGADARLSTTAYIAWAVFQGSTSDAEPTRRYLLAHRAQSLNDPYVLALMANALNVLDADGRAARPYLDRLEALKRSADDGKSIFWQQPEDSRTAFYGAGRGGSVETTALATLALLHRNRSPETTRRALAWLVKQKDGRGTWPSTQATVLALKALIAGSNTLAADGERRITLNWDGENQEIVIPADQAEVMKQIDLSPRLKTGTHRLTLTETSRTAAGYQVAFRYHVPDADGPPKSEAFGVQFTCDRKDVRVDDIVTATATITNRRTQASPMVVVELPIPAGFAFDGDNLAALLKDKKIEKYQHQGRSVAVYLRGLDAGQSLALKYGLRATMPVKVSVSPARAYEYYDPDQQGRSATGQLTAASR